ncbi:MAG TPA: hypothetical protein VG052_13420 [Puia sp.]|jgi:hypothetical protein|nr:hypothetical protein [Puia sp.]
MERRTRYGTILLLILTTGLFIYGFFFHSWPSDQPAAKANLSITAGELALAFDRNESRSDSLFLHKALSVRGIIRQISENGSGGYTATMEGNSPDGTAVEGHMDSRYNSRYAALKAGDSLRLLGICAGRLGNVILVQCIIEK